MRLDPEKDAATRGGPPLVGASLLVTLILGAPLLGVSGCTRPTEPAGGPAEGIRLPEGIGDPAEAGPGESDGAPRLRLRVEPERGRMPLLVRFEAELLGEIDDPEAFECPTLAWTTDSRDDGEVVIAQATGCREGEVQRRFALEHAYLRARAYEASVRLVARDVPPSNLVQILVEGPTATPAAQVALPGPTIVVATPGRPLPTRTPGAPAATADVDTPDLRDPAVTTDPTDAANPAGPEPKPATSARVLPADLYYLSGEPPALWRLAAAGGPPQPIVEARDAAEGVETYAVSRNRVVAFTAGGALRIGLADRDGPLRASSVLTESAATDLIWTRDGRRLSYAADGVWSYDQRGRLQRRWLDAGRPLTWSRQGRKLLALGAEGELVLIDVEAEPARNIVLPIEGVRAAGFFPDRDVAWLADEDGGLRLLSLDEDYRLLPVDFDAEIGAVEAVFVRPDRKLLALALRSGLAEAHALDLQGHPSASAIGAPIVWDEADRLAWAPDGRLAAAAGPRGLRLLDPSAGSEVSLLRGTAAQPVWILGQP